MDIDNQYIVSQYNLGKTQKQIANDLNVSQTGISLILKRNNIKTRVGKKIKYKANIDFFKTIHEEKQAYYLGLLYADGNVYIKNNTYIVSLKLQKKDIHILKEFRKNISPASLIKTIKIKKKEYVVFRIFQKEICEQLIALGCVPKKSLILKFPDLNPNLIHHFVRGYFDGDGTIYKNNNNYIWKIVSTKTFCEKLKDILEKELNINCCLYVLKNKTTSILLVGGNNQSMKVFDWMYNESKIFLNRKFMKYEEFKRFRNL